MAAFIGTVLAEALTLFFVFVLVLAISEIPPLRRYPLSVHVAGVAIVCLVAALIAPVASSPPAAYLVTLAAIGSYRRGMRIPPSLWYRLALASAILWCAAGLLALKVSGIDPDEPAALAPACIFALLGLSPWAIGWLSGVL